MPCEVKTAYVSSLRSTPEVTQTSLITALVELMYRADWSGLVEAERVVEVLGWTHPTQMPDNEWIRTQLTQHLCKLDSV